MQLRRQDIRHRDRVVGVERDDGVAARGFHVRPHSGEVCEHACRERDHVVRGMEIIDGLVAEALSDSTPTLMPEPLTPNPLSSRASCTWAAVAPPAPMLAFVIGAAWDPAVRWPTSSEKAKSVAWGYALEAGPLAAAES
jgi:hypothetical protein